MVNGAVTGETNGFAGSRQDQMTILQFVNITDRSYFSQMYVPNKAADEELDHE
jgi:hypothetical protein